MSQSDNIDQLTMALLKVQSQLRPAPKDATNPYFKSNYATLESVWDVARKPLAENGLVVIQTGCVLEGGVQLLKTTLSHVSGQYISGDYILANAKPTDPQSQGSSMTYARRYCLAAILGIVTSDDDAEAATERQEKAQNLQSRIQAPKPPIPKPMPGELNQVKVPAIPAHITQEVPPPSEDNMPETSFDKTPEAVFDPLSSYVWSLRYGKFTGKTLGEIGVDGLIWARDNLNKSFFATEPPKGRWAELMARVDEYIRVNS